MLEPGAKGCRTYIICILPIKSSKSCLSKSSLIGLLLEPPAHLHGDLLKALLAVGPLIHVSVAGSPPAHRHTSNTQKHSSELLAVISYNYSTHAYCYMYILAALESHEFGLQKKGGSLEYLN